MEAKLGQAKEASEDEITAEEEELEGIRKRKTRE